MSTVLVHGDFSGSGDIGFPDFLQLANNFGSSGVTVSAVPEPAGALLLLIGIGVLARQRRSFASGTRSA